MRDSTHPFILAFCIAAFPAGAHAQSMAASFDELSRVLKVGDVVYVTDTAGATTWGTAHQLSESSLTVAVREPSRDKGFTTTAEMRVFAKGSLARISRSNESGREGALVYPPSWEEVLSVPTGAELTIVLDTGEKRRYRFGSATADGLRLRTSAGCEETLGRGQIRRIVRHGFSDPTSDGVLIGALVGAGATLAAATRDPKCGSNCSGSGPTAGPMAAVGAGIGAAIGWAIDKAHRGTNQVFPAPPARALRIGVLPAVGARERSLTVSLAF